jgi:hypothetical protein
LNNLTREPGGEKQSSDQKILPRNCHRSWWRWEGWGLRKSAYAVWPITKDLVVMSQWVHRPWNLKISQAALVWPVAVFPASQARRTVGMCPCLVWKTSQLSGA